MNYEWLHKEDIVNGKLGSLFTLRVKGLTDATMSERKPLCLVVVVDISGSMEELAYLDSGRKMTRLHAVKLALIELFTRLSPRDRLGIVLFESYVEILFPLMKCSPENIEKMKKKIFSVECRNCTNISAGLLVGLDMLKNRKDKKKTNSSLLLFTDGDANKGVTDPDSYSDLLSGNLQHEKVRRTYRYSKVPSSHDIDEEVTSENILRVYQKRQRRKRRNYATEFTPQRVNYLEGNNATIIHTFGFGTHHSDALMTSISKSGSGTYYFVDNASVLKPSFLDCLGGLLSITVKNIQISMMPYHLPDRKITHRIRRVRTSYEETKTLDGRYIFEIPYLKADESRDMMIQMEFLRDEFGEFPFSNIIEPETPLLEIGISYTDQIQDKRIKQKIICVYQDVSSLDVEVKREKYRRIEEFEVRTASWVQVGHVKDTYLPDFKFKESREVFEGLIDMIRKNPLIFPSGREVESSSCFCNVLIDILETFIQWFIRSERNHEFYERMAVSKRICVFYEYLLLFRDLEEFKKKMIDEKKMEKYFVLTPDQMVMNKRSRSNPQTSTSSDNKKRKKDKKKNKKNCKRTYDEEEIGEKKWWVGKNFHCSCCDGRNIRFEGNNITHKCGGQSRSANISKVPLTKFRFRCIFKRDRLPCTMDQFIRWKGNVMLGARRSLTLLCGRGNDAMKPLLKEIGYDVIM